VGIASGWTGVRPLSPDHHPIIGPVAGVEGFVNSCAWGGEGIMHSPIGGQLVAEYIHAGAPRTFPIDRFLLSRFDDRRDLATPRSSDRA
ncbi:MAG: FAD-binding oxidoreductase, partial [Anaerolineae bacterium]|nr:FAD-binding oxidoreductase [Anaerolineae bacterium]